MSEIDAAVRDLHRRRKAVVDAIAESDLGRALDRIDAAIAALTGEAPSSPAPEAKPGRKKREPQAGSVRHKAQTLIDRMEGPWTYDAVLAYYEDAGNPVQGEDPKAALRTAFSAMVQSGDAYRVADGLFKSSKFAATPEEGQ